MKVVEVVWVDIEELSAGWFTQDEVDEFISNHHGRTVRVIGYLYEDDPDDDKVTICNSIAGGEFGNVTVIPRGCIRSMEVLKS